MELRKKIEAKIFALPERIVKTDNGDLLVNTIGTKLVTVYNLHKKRKEKYTLKEFAFFALGKNWSADTFDALLRESFEDLALWEKEVERYNKTI